MDKRRLAERRTADDVGIANRRLKAIFGNLFSLEILLDEFFDQNRG